MIPEWIFQLLMIGGSALSMYVAIRVDLVEARLTAQNAAESAKECHFRLDKHIEAKH